MQPVKIMALNDRIKEVRKENKLSQDEFANKIGIQRGLYSMIELGKSTPALDVISKIANLFGKSYAWLIDGKNTPNNNEENFTSLNEVLPDYNTEKNTQKNTPNNTPKELKVSKNTPLMPKVISVDTTGEENIFFVPHKVSAGYLTGYADPEFMGTLPSYRLPNLNNGTYRMFEVKGHSMKPTVNDGDKVIGLWIDALDIKDERVYVVVSKEEGITIKRCINRITEYGKLILKPDNREYTEIMLEAEDILEVWDVKMYLSAKLPAPGESFYAISDLQARMIMLEDIVKRNLKG